MVTRVSGEGAADAGRSAEVGTARPSGPHRGRGGRR
jgi:hypothetical protein